MSSRFYSVLIPHRFETLRKQKYTPFSKQPNTMIFNAKQHSKDRINISRML